MGLGLRVLGFLGLKAEIRVEEKCIEVKLPKVQW